MRWAYSASPQAVEGFISTVVIFHNQKKRQSSEGPATNAVERRVMASIGFGISAVLPPNDFQIDRRRLFVNRTGHPERAFSFDYIDSFRKHIFLHVFGKV